METLRPSILFPFMTGERSFPPPLLRFFVAMCAAPHSPGEVSSPNPSATAPADHPALPEDRQPLPDASRSPADHVSDVISGTAGRGFPLLTDRLASGFATTTRVSPSFALRAATRVMPHPRGLSCLRSRGLRNPPPSGGGKLASGIAWRWVPIPPAPRRAPPKQWIWRALGRLSGGCPSQSAVLACKGHLPSQVWHRGVSGKRPGS
jgi:hypothetical protein